MSTIPGKLLFQHFDIAELPFENACAKRDAGVCVLSQGTDFGEGRKTPGFAKGIMLFQTLIILFLSSWIYEEYLNNIYLQAYVNDTFQAYGALIAVIVIVGAVGLTFGLLKVLKSTHNQIGELVSQPEGPSLGARSGSSTLAKSSPKPAVDLHPMVAALKADLAHQSEMQPIPPLEVKEVASQAAQVPAAPPSSPPGKAMAGTPSTVITGTMPVLKRVNPDQDKNQNSR